MLVELEGWENFAVKRLLISGYYGFHNAGDEAVLLAILQRLRERCPAWQPVVLSADPASTARLYGVEAHHRWRWPEVVREVRRCAAFLSGGGSLLQDVTGRASLLYYLSLIWLAKLCGKPVFIYAQGIGPLRHRDSRLLVRATLRRVDGLAVRDADSAACLASLGVRRPVAVTADPVFALNPHTLADTAQASQVLHRLGLENGSRPLALLNLRELPAGDRGRQAPLVEAAKALVAHLATAGWRVLLLPLHWPHDLTACRWVGSAAVIDTALPLSTLLGLFALADLVVAMRLHALIFAALFHRPLVGLVYDPKVAAFLKQVNAPGLDLASLSPQGLIASVGAAWEGRRQWQESLPGLLAPLRERAAATADLLYEVLEGNQPGPGTV